MINLCLLWGDLMEPIIVQVGESISDATIAAIDADPMFKVDEGADPRIVQGLGSASMGLLLSFLMPYLKAALIKYLQDGVMNPSAVQVFASAQRLAEMKK